MFWWSLGLMSLGGAAKGADVSVPAGGDWCAAVNAAAPGDTVTLEVGDYEGPCWLTTSGEEGAPITVLSEAANIVYEGTSSNVVDIAASHLVLDGLYFGPTHADIDAIKIRSGDDLTITRCGFVAVGGISISANSADTSGVTISDNQFYSLQATGIYLGCHDGSCTSAGFLIADNIFQGVTSSGVGYAMETKLGSYGTIRGNSVSDAQGPAVEVYGSEAGDLTVVEGNLLIASRANATLEIGGGPALVRNNVVIGGEGAALYVYDYGGRGLVQGITVQGNTLWGVGGAAVELSGWASGAELRFDDNAVGRDDGASAMPEVVSGVSMVGNVDCGDGLGCWVDPAGGDLWPLEGGLLVGAGAETDPELTEDWCGWERGSPLTAGALEPSSGSGPFEAGLRQADLCAEGGGGTDTGEPDTGGVDSGGVDSGALDSGGVDSDDTAGSGGSGGDDKDADCGCAGGGPASGLGWALALALVAARRRARGTDQGSLGGAPQSR